ncbi:hypothetical protein ACHQM5_006478 [Ranunculus cassubicifolius]
MDHLPIDITQEILSNFPLKSLLEYRSVNKTWRANIDLYRSTCKLKKSAFLFLQSNSGKLFIAEEDQEFHFKSTRIGSPCPPNCSLFSPKPCNGGFLSFFSVDFEDNFCSYLYNPATGNYTKLPQFESSKLVDASVKPRRGVRTSSSILVPGVGVDYSTGETKVVQMFTPVKLSSRNDHTEAQIHSLGSNSWRKMENVPGLICFDGFSPVVNGSLHWLTNKKSILSFDLAMEKFGIVDLPPLSLFTMSTAPEFSQWNFRMMDLGGCLSISDSSYADHTEIWIMKHYNVKESWIKINVASQYAYEDVFKLKNVCPISVSNNGDLVLLYGSKILVSYNIDSGTYTPFNVSGILGYKFGYQTRYEVHPYVGYSMPRVLRPKNSMPQTCENPDPKVMK